MLTEGTYRTTVITRIEWPYCLRVAICSRWIEANLNMDILKRVFSFPNPVNEITARLVAGMVVALSLAAIATGHPVIVAFLVYGFLARVATGPTLSIMGLLATRVIVPVLGYPPRMVPGPPKRFAQMVGLALSSVALILLIVQESVTGARIVLGVVALFAALEAFVGFCAGCVVFSYLMRWGFVPESVCRQCVVPQDTTIK